jgi:NAD(P)-dependent dehydrogenase (short-subunit alcohol dehydrogenase family)
MNHASYPSLRGRTAFVTGGASGIGAAIVRAFAAQGARVGFVDLDAAASAQLVAETKGDLAYETCDLRDIDALRRAFGALRNWVGPADILVNNAARDDRHDWAEVTPDYWDDRIATNLRHVFFAAQAVAEDMIAAGGGAIVNLGSASVPEKTANLSAYVTAKAGIHGLTRALARDLGGHRIRVNTVVPGWVMTERQKELWVTPEGLEALQQKQCLPDLIQPEHIARMVLFLASDEAAMCTANEFMVEAGST